MGEKGLSGTAGGETFDDDDVVEGVSEPEPEREFVDERVWMPDAERVPAYASNPPTTSGDQAGPGANTVENQGDTSGENPPGENIGDATADHDTDAALPGVAYGG